MNRRVVVRPSWTRAVFVACSWTRAIEWVEELLPDGYVRVAVLPGLLLCFGGKGGSVSVSEEVSRD